MLQILPQKIKPGTGEMAHWNHFRQRGAKPYLPGLPLSLVASGPRLPQPLEWAFSLESTLDMCHRTRRLAEVCTVSPAWPRAIGKHLVIQPG